MTIGSMDITIYMRPDRTLKGLLKAQLRSQLVDDALLGWGPVLENMAWALNQRSNDALSPAARTSSPSPSG